VAGGGVVVPATAPAPVSGGPKILGPLLDQYLRESLVDHHGLMLRL
jgi:hypothetical protein